MTANDSNHRSRSFGHILYPRAIMGPVPSHDSVIFRISTSLLPTAPVPIASFVGRPPRRYSVTSKNTLACRLPLVCLGKALLTVHFPRGREVPADQCREILGVLGGRVGDGGAISLSEWCRARQWTATVVPLLCANWKAEFVGMVEQRSESPIGPRRTGQAWVGHTLV